MLRNWEFLREIRPDYHHHFKARGTSNEMFNELAIPNSFGRDETCVSQTSHEYIDFAAAAKFR